MNVHSKLTVISSTPIGPGKTHPLTALDHAMATHTGHIIFYYRVNPFVEGRFEFDLDNLRVSLCELLSKYPSITGRLARRPVDGNWEVNCNDAGVRMLRASVGSTTLEEWLRTADASEERDLAVWEDLPDDDPSIWSPFQIQLNTFEGGGLAIGLSFSHMLADPTSATRFLKSWTELKRGEAIAQDPIFCLPTVDTRTPKPTIYYATKSKTESPVVKMGSATFRFPHSTIEKRLSEVLDKCHNATPFDFLAAVFWTRIARLKVPANDKTNSISVCVDVRNLLQLPASDWYFGNALHFSQLSVDKEVLDDGKLEDVIAELHRHVSGVDKEDFLPNVKWLESRKGDNGQYPPPFQMYGPELTCVSMEHMMIGKSGNDGSLVYATKFQNDEKPVHVSYHVGNAQGEGLILVMPSPEEGLARTVTVTLPEEQIAKLCEDQAILDLKPTMIISGRS